MVYRVSLTIVIFSFLSWLNLLFLHALIHQYAHLH